MAMRFWRLLLAALAVAVIGGGPVRSVAAQDGGEEPLDFADLEGIEEVVSRTYSVDVAAMLASPAAGGDPAFLDAEGFVTVVTLIAEFYEAGNAESGWERLNGVFEDQAGASAGDASTAYLEIDASIGDNAAAYIATFAEAGTEFSTAFFVVQDAEYVYVVIGVTAAEDPVAPTTAVVEVMIANDEGEGEGEIGDDGFHRGGLWDKLPAVGDDVLDGLAPLADEQVYPVSEATPEA